MLKFSQNMTQLANKLTNDYLPKDSISVIQTIYEDDIVSVTDQLLLSFIRDYNHQYTSANLLTTRVDKVYLNSWWNIHCVVASNQVHVVDHYLLEIYQIMKHY